MVMNQQKAPSFVESTRRKVIQLETKSKPSGGGLVTWTLPSNGILSSIGLAISQAISSAGLSNLNALGLASCIRRVSLSLNGGVTIFSFSGAGYHWLYRNMIYDESERMSYTDARSAVATGTKDLSMFIPVALNNREQIGYVMLQNPAVQATLAIDFEADSVIATGITANTATVTPSIEVFEVPTDPHSAPDLSTIHQVLEDQLTISASGNYDHNILLGATLVGLYTLVNGSTWTTSQLIAQQSNYIETHTPESHRMFFNMFTGDDANLSGGAITGSNKRVFYDMLGSDGLGNYGSIRDVIDTQSLSSLIHRINLAGACTLHVLRRQIVKIS